MTENWYFEYLHAAFVTGCVNGTSWAVRLAVSNVINPSDLQNSRITVFCTSAKDLKETVVLLWFWDCPEDRDCCYNPLVALPESASKRHLSVLFVFLSVKHLNWNLEKKNTCIFRLEHFLMGKKNIEELSSGCSITFPAAKGRRRWKRQYFYLWSLHKLLISVLLGFTNIHNLILIPH